MGRAHLSAAERCADAHIEAIVDPALSAAGASCSRVRLSDVEDVLASDEIEGLLIAAPTSLHESLVERALACGKHVLCEKPLTTSIEADLRLAAQAVTAGRVLQVGFWRRFAEPYRRLRALLRAGDLGEPRAMRASQWDAASPPVEFCDVGVSGGIEVDCGVHEFDLARWLLDREVEEVTAVGSVSPGELTAVGDVSTALGLGRLSPNGLLSVDLTRTAGYRDSIRTEIICEHGSAVLEFDSGGEIAVRAGASRRVLRLAARDVIADALVAQLTAFAIGSRAVSAHLDAASAIDSSRALSAALAMRQARRDGGWITPDTLAVM
jgi:myo-inositol 2-dehydrogenase/D-chiro-inositol 1-dehydrogenase